MKFFSAAFSFAKHSIWRDNTPDVAIFDAAKLAFDEMSKGCSRGRHFFRLAGQSGSGKTSQLFKSHSSVLKKMGMSPIHIAVRNFAKFHPDYKQLSTKCDCRELTNGFALKVLICVLDMALNNGLDIVLEIALLDKRFEKLIIQRLKQNKYRGFYHILAVNKLLSEIFIFKRKIATSRTTFSSSSDYFYKTMQKTLKFLTRNGKFDCCVWSAYDLLPVFHGNISQSYRHFRRAQKIMCPLPCSEKTLLIAKQDFLEELYHDVRV